MNTAVATAVSLKNVFFVTDLGEASRAAFPYVLALATRYRSRLNLIHSLGPVPFAPIPLESLPPLEEYPRKLTLPEMEKLQKECLAHGVETKLTLKDGELLDVLAEAVGETKPDLIVVGTNSHGAIYRMFAGSHAEKVLRHAPCSVLTVGRNARGAAHWRDRIARILVATNFEEGSRHAAETIAPIAFEHCSEVTVMHVIDEPAGVPLDMAELEAHYSVPQLEKFAAETSLGSDVKLQLAVGDAKREIAGFANCNDIDLIVMGRKKGGFFTGHEPSTTVLGVAAESRCPVLTVA